MRYGSEKPSTYIPRIIDERVERALGIFGAVEIRGTKWCGKSWTARAFGESIVHVDDDNVKTLVSSDPALALAGARPHVIDEWQEVPAIWDAARRRIDEEGGRGMYLLAGSSTPEKDKVSHSGAGRIARLDMATMTQWELGQANGLVSLSDLFARRFQAAPSEANGLAPVAEQICHGGWPAMRDAPQDAAEEAVRHYLDALFEVSVSKKGGTARTARRIAASLARNVATSAKLQTLAADAQGGDEGAGVSATTVTRYLELFEDLYFIEELPGWDAPVRATSRLRTKPKRYFADPSLAASLLGISPARLLRDGQTFGLLFESLCVHDLRVYASVLDGGRGGSLYYYGDADGLEVDVIIELRDGRWAAIEVETGEDKVPDGIHNLDRLRQKVARNPAARNPAPTFCAVLTATAPFVRYDREHDVYVFPLSALRP